MQAQSSNQTCMQHSSTFKLNMIYNSPTFGKLLRQERKFGSLRSCLFGCQCQSLGSEKLFLTFRCLVELLSRHSSVANLPKNALQERAKFPFCCNRQKIFSTRSVLANLSEGGCTPALGCDVSHDFTRVHQL